jgi:hypothetical protein
MTPRLVLRIVWIAVQIAVVLTLGDVTEALVLYQNY